MRTKLRGKMSLLFVLCAVLIAVPAVAAFADIVTNEVRSGPGGNNRVVTPEETGGQAVTTTVKFWIEANNQGSFAGCDATPSSPASVSVSASAQTNTFGTGQTPATIGISPNPQSFTACSSDGGATNFKSYTFTIPAGAPSGTYNVSASVSDAAGSYNVNQASFDLVVNRPPTADAGGDANEKYFVNVGSTVTLNGSGTDPENKPLTYAWKFNNVDENNDGNLYDDATVQNPTFSAVGKAAGNYPVELKVTDQAGLTATDDATVVVQNPNTPPVANNDNYSVNEGGTLNVSAPGVLGNDTDANSNPLTATLVGTGPSNASSFNFNPDGSFVYIHDGSETTSDSFTYKANDGTVDSNVAQVNITIAPVDDPPTAVNDSATVQEDDPATAINVLSNDTDADGGPKTITSKTNGSHGTVSITDGGSGLTYEPTDDYCNDPPGTSPDTFTYTLNGGSTATVSVKVTCVNDAPTTPGAITSDESLNNDGTFKLNWADSTDVDSANITYTLEHRDFGATSDWSEVASDLTASEYTFVGTNPEEEGLWDYRVKAVDDYSPPASSDFREDLDLVTVDKTNPNAPTLSFATGAGQSLRATVDGVDWYKNSALINVSANGDPVNARDGSPGSGVNAASFPASFSVTTNGESTASKTVKDNATNESAADELTVHVDAADPTFSSCQGGTFLVNSGGGTQSVSINASDGESGIDSASQLTKSVDTSSTGTKTVTFTAKDKVGHSITKNCDYTVNTHTFIGFSSPVDNPNYLNVMKAGQAVPLKWLLKDASGNPVTNLQSVTVTVKDMNCSLGATADQVEEFAAGSSSLQNLGGGYYQFNWKSPTGYAKSCKTLTVNGVGVQQSALFNFTK
jgi:large repetitive protein